MLVWDCADAAFGPDEDARRTLFCCRPAAFDLARLIVPPADTCAGKALAVRGTAASAVLEAIAATLTWYSLPSDVSSTHTSELSSVPFAGGAVVLISAGYTSVTLAPAATLKPTNCSVCPAAHVVKPPTPSQYAASDSSLLATVVFAGTVAVTSTECVAVATLDTVTAYRTRCPGAAGSGVATARTFSTVSVALPTPVVNPACASTTCVVGLRNAASAAN